MCELSNIQDCFVCANDSGVMGHIRYDEEKNQLLYTEPQNVNRDIAAYALVQDGTLTATFELVIEDDRSFNSGREVFGALLKTFESHGHSADRIQACWVDGDLRDNLDTFNKVANDRESLESAARQTWTGKMATEHGFTGTPIFDFSRCRWNDEEFTAVYVTFPRV